MNELKTRAYYENMAASDVFDVAELLENIDKLEAQNKALRDALDGCYPLAIAHAGTYQAAHGLPNMHPEHAAIIGAASIVLNQKDQEEIGAEDAVEHHD